MGTVAWAKISHLRHFFQNLLGVKVHILAGKSQNFVDTLRPQKPMWTKFLEFDFSLSEKTRSSSSYINLTMKLLVKV